MLYNQDGSISVTAVAGDRPVGMYAPDGSINVVIDDQDNKGVQHPTGALRVNSVGSSVSNKLNQLKQTVWNSPLDSFYLFAQPTEAQALQDLVKPDRTATTSGDPMFTPNRGYTGDGYDAYIDTKYNPSTDAVNFSQNSNSFGVWCVTNPADPSGGWDFGQTNYAIAPFGTGGRDVFTRNSSTTSNNFQYWPQKGNLYGANRKSSTGYSVFQNGSPVTLNLTSVANSGNIKTGLHGQGWCTDGTYYYVFEQDAIRKRSRSDWSIISSNTNVFAGLNGSPNHLGDGDIYGNYLYNPVEYYSGSCSTPSSDLQIARYDLSTLALADTHTITGPTEIGALAIDGARGVIYVSSYCDPTQIFCYSLSDYSRLPSIQLSSRDFNFKNIQGLAYRNNSLWISCISSGAVAPNRFLVNVDLTGQVRQICSIFETSAQLEGVNFDSDGKIGVMQDDGGVNQYIYFYNLPADNTLTYAQVSSAVNSETFTVFKRNGVLTNTSAQVAACFTGGSMTASQWQNLYTSLYNYLREVGAATW